MDEGRGYNQLSNTTEDIQYPSSSSHLRVLDHLIFGVDMILATTLSYDNILWDNFYVYHILIVIVGLGETCLRSM